MLKSVIAAIALSMSAPLFAASPAFLQHHQTSAADIQAIEGVLHAYTSAVNHKDEASFRALLLDEHVPFLAVDGRPVSGAAAADPDTRDYASFRDAIFRSPTHYDQSFYNVHIEQDGRLAQVTLDFITRVAGTDQGGYGFKVLTLLKVQGQWRIASEFYTGYPLPKA